MIWQCHIDSPLGPLTLKASEKGLIALAFNGCDHMDQHPELVKAKQQLNEYFQGRRQSFDLCYDLNASQFQLKAWNFLINTQYGKTYSYQQQAIGLGDSALARAVGAANAKNPLPILIPCHRVIGKNNKLQGYSGGLQRKKFLLELENPTMITGG